MGHDHAPVTAGGRHRGRLAWALGIAAGVFVLEVIGAWITGSLALLADAGHVLTDVLGVALALVAATMAENTSSALFLSLTRSSSSGAAIIVAITPIAAVVYEP